MMDETRWKETRCQQCWDHRCIPKRCKCTCHEEITKIQKEYEKQKKEEQKKAMNFTRRHENDPEIKKAVKEWEKSQK